MNNSATNTNTPLSGDLTIAGVAHQTEVLTNALFRIESGGEKRLRIDCGEIVGIDMCGLQLLYVWMECARIRGVETLLVNLPDSMQQVVQRLGLMCFFAGHSPDAA